MRSRSDFPLYHMNLTQIVGYCFLLVHLNNVHSKCWYYQIVLDLMHNEWLIYNCKHEPDGELWNENWNFFCVETLQTLFATHEYTFNIFAHLANASNTSLQNSSPETRTAFVGSYLTSHMRLQLQVKGVTWAWCKNVKRTLKFSK